MIRFRPLLALMLLSLLVPAMAPAQGAGTPPAGGDADRNLGRKRDPRWYAGHEYRQWIYDQNYIADGNSNLDPDIDYVAEGRVRVHPEKVYFYNDMEAAIDLARDTAMPLIFHVFDHTCQDCLYVLPELYTRPETVAGSHDFVNVYVELPRQQRDCVKYGLMGDGLTVQFFLPGMRRLRVLDDPTAEEIVEFYDKVLEYVAGLDEEELYRPPVSR